MMRIALTLLASLILQSQATAWNNTGHMVVAKIAWNQLTDDDRAKISQLLKKHPHYQLFLIADQPANVDEGEWAFLKAATWPDFVRNGPPAIRKYSVPKRHFVDMAIVQEGSSIQPPKLDPENAMEQIPLSVKIAKSGTGEECPVELAWVLHLTGDIHQPLHCASFFGDTFPQGDRGGNSSVIKLQSGGTIQMHHFWDGLLGESTRYSAISGMANEIEALLKTNPDMVKDDLAKNLTPDKWAAESNANAIKFAYRVIPPANSQEHPSHDLIPVAPADYATNAGEVARYCAGKAGKRLAALLHEIAAANSN